MSTSDPALSMYRKMWSDLGMNLELHDQVIESMERVHRTTHLSRKNRPLAMSEFDAALHGAHGSRVAEIVEHRRRGGKSIGTFCIYVPDEIALAVGVIPMPLCGGTGWSVDYADKMFPRDICPLVRSTFGLAFSGTCPYKTLKEFALGETTCDAKKKAWDLLGFPSLEVPQKKTDMDRDLWLSEVKRFAREMEKITGRPVEREALALSIRKVNDRRRALQRINGYRMLAEPPISGLDALLVSQTALSMDIDAFISAAGRLEKELESRATRGVSAYEKPGPRILYAGSPSPMGYSKIHFVAETSGLRIVADESCTGSRYYRDLVEEGRGDLDSMYEAIADRYFSIDCACFSPNSERFDNVRRTAGEFGVSGILHGVLQYCHGYDIEARALDKALADLSIPSLKIVTDYSEQDIEQIRVRVEAFRELVEHGGSR